MRYLPIALLIAISTVGCDEGLKSKSDGVSGSRTNVPSTPSGQDDSTANTRERNGTAKTPLDQNENQKDITITADIRKRVVDSKLSTKAQNVKVITQNGVVTLRGFVSSEGEKKDIEEISRSVVGVERVDNQLEIEKNP